MTGFAPAGTLLGKSTRYIDTYSPELLTPIPRELGRSAIGRHGFIGTDIWRLYEVTWLDPRGLPQAACAEIRVPASSPCIVESKSLKLYIVSLTQTKIGSRAEAQALIQRNVSRAAGAEVEVRLMPVSDCPRAERELPGTLLEAENLGDVSFSHYEVDPGLLRARAGAGLADETLRTELFRSRCPVTGQPDFASVAIGWRGPALDHAALLAYLVSYRSHQGFHEQCCEQIFTDLTHAFSPERLWVYACFTRRGGIDISPFRSNGPALPGDIIRAVRQ
jgi:7-cyano-7-deazaguanine reductase